MNLIDITPGNSKSDLKNTINALGMRKVRIQKKMRLMARQLRYNDEIDMDMVNAYQKLNEDLRAVKIYEAEFCYKKNML